MSDSVTIGGVVMALGKVLADHPHAKEFTFRRETLEALVSQPPGLRDEFARAALPALMSQAVTNGWDDAWTAQRAYQLADAMLAAREGT